MLRAKVQFQIQKQEKLANLRDIFSNLLSEFENEIEFN